MPGRAGEILEASIVRRLAVRLPHWTILLYAMCSIGDPVDSGLCGTPFSPGIAVELTLR